jgi:hypothetical protein
MIYIYIIYIFFFLVLPCCFTSMERAPPYPADRRLGGFQGWFR